MTDARNVVDRNSVPSEMWRLFHGRMDPADCGEGCLNCDLMREERELARLQGELSERTMTLLVKQEVLRGLK